MKKVLPIILVICLLAASALCLFPASATDGNTATYDGWVEAYGTVITSDIGTQTNSGGARTPRVINDGLMPAVGNTVLINSYDSYIPAKRADQAGAEATFEEYIGYTFAQSYTVTELVFQEGAAAAGGGYFEGKTLHVEIYNAKTQEWTDVATNIASVYSQSETFVADEHVANACYTIKLDTATACDGIRLYGTAGGTNNYFSCSELKVKATGLTLTGGRVETISSPIISRWFSTRDTTAGGDENLNCIRDGIIANDFTKEFGNYKNTNNTAFAQSDNKGYIGYEFPQSFSIERLTFKAGTAWVNGGWFADGVKVEALKDGVWTEVESNAATVYTVSNNQADHAVNDAVSGTNKGYAEYHITLNKPVECDGIRLAGTFGGSHFYITCLEFRVYQVGAPVDVDFFPEEEDESSATDSTVTPETPADTGNKPAETDNKPAETDNKPAETTTAKVEDTTTKAAVTTTAAATTKAAVTTKASTTAAEESGCGGSIAIGALAVSVTLGGVVLLKKKKED